VVHKNTHFAAGGDPYRGQLASGQKAIHEDVNAWDGLVFLTDSHRRDYEARFGSAGNLVTVSNPKQPLEHLPDHAGRSPRRGVLLGRLAPQKNLAHAVRVMAKVRESVPDAVLDIYGKGAQEAELRSLIDELELQGTVRLRGHVPRAVAEFDSAGFSLLTSRNEGQPLALLESMGHGCPAVAYDIRYGPSDVVDDGVNGFLVPAGDIDAAARRVVELCTDTEMAARMGAAAWRSAGRYADAEVLSRWREVLGQAWDRQSSRSRVHTLELAEKAYRLLGSGTIEMECAVTWQQDAGAPFEREVAGDVLAVPRKTGSPVVLPLRFGERKPGGVACTVVWDPALVDGLVEAPETILDLFLRLRTGDVLRSFRLAVPVAPDAFLPYADPEQGLSIQRLGA
jgi:poly(glycerol-phosphate) alpha-glucosyltransferase